MSLWRSTPLRRPPAGQLLALGMVLWLVPFILGRGVIGLAQVLPASGIAGLVAAIGGLLLFSPLLAWLGWLVALPGAWVLIRTGRFAWAPVAALGAMAGTVAALAVVASGPPSADRWASLAALLPLCMIFGVIATLTLRLLSGLVMPATIAPATPQKSAQHP